MIALTCNHCSATLEIDDAFAGSTCRCQHCGTIQTVPSPSSAGKRPASPVSSSSRTLYAERRRGTGSGLDQLADVVTSSGLRHARKPASGVFSGDTGASDPSIPAVARRPTALIAIGAVLGVVLGLVAAVAIFRSGSSDKTAPASLTATSAAPPSGPEAIPTPGPSFCDIRLDDQSVVYVLDRGSSARESLGHIVAATLASARTLGRDRRFQVMFWDNGQEAVAYPPNSPGFATPETIAAAARAIESVTPFGRSDAIPALRRAVSVRPDSIVLVTAKGWELDEGFVQSALLARGQSQCKIHTVSIGGAESGESMEKLAQATGGTFAAVSIAELRQFARGD